jgi:glucose-6-phosphate dehydrogenase assembly protein OpcA
MASTVSARLVDSWSAEATDAASIDVALRRSRARHGPGMSRLAAFTLVVLVERDSRDLDGVLAMAEAVVARRPGRAVVFVTHSADGAKVDATLKGWVLESPGTGPVWTDSLVVRMPGPLGPQIDDLVEQLVLPATPVVVWASGYVPNADAPVPAAATKVVVDTARAVSAASLRGVLQMSDHVPVVDLAWLATEPWRSVTAHLFAGEEFLAFQSGVERARVVGDKVATGLLPAWLLARLGLPSHAMEILGGERVEIRLSARRSADHAMFEVVQTSPSDVGTVVRARAGIAGGPSNTRLVRIATPAVEQLLDRAVVGDVVGAAWRDAMVVAIGQWDSMLH